VERTAEDANVRKDINEITKAFELAERGLSFERQKEFALVYRGVKLDCGYRVDFIVEGEVVVEVKAVNRLEPIHEAQLLSYLRLSGHRAGLLINFNVMKLKDGIRRLVLGLDEIEPDAARRTHKRPQGL